MTAVGTALATTVGRGDASLVDFVRYHLAVGFDRVFVFLDDPDDAAAAAIPDDDRVTLVPHDDDLRACWADWPALRRMAGHDLATRRILNTDVALQLCRNDDLAWLVAVDPDELVDTGGAAIGDLLAGAGAATGQLVLAALLAIPETEHAAGGFAGATLFRLPRPAGATPPRHAAQIAAAGHTAATWYGPTVEHRAAVRIAPGVLPLVDRTFSLGNAERHTIAAAAAAAAAAPRVLAYREASLAAFVRRHTGWQPAVPAPLGHVPLRQPWIDAVLAPRIAVGRGPDAAARYFRDRIAVGDPAIRAALIADGLCERIDIARRILGDAPDPAATPEDA